MHRGYLNADWLRAIVQPESDRQVFINLRGAASATRLEAGTVSKKFSTRLNWNDLIQNIHRRLHRHLQRVEVQIFYVMLPWANTEKTGLSIWPVIGRHSYIGPDTEPLHIGFAEAGVQIKRIGRC